jgi:hypothetical protein
MKIALCLMGIVGTSDAKYGIGDKIVDYRIAHFFHTQNIIEPNQKLGDTVDIFIHSWSTEFKDKLVEIYNPKKYLIEPQINFGFENVRENSVKSRWYSTKKVVELKSEYEKETGVLYDFVMIYRLDHILLKPLVFSNFDNSNFYCSHRDDCVKSCKCLNTMRFYDAWFFSNSNYIDKFATLYDTLNADKLESPHLQTANYIKETGLIEKLKHVFFFRTDHDTVREIFSNCEYDPNNEFDVNKLIKNDKT